MTLEDKVHASRLLLFRRAQQVGNVSAACQELGVSRSLYCQLRKRFVRYGPDGLHPKRRQGRPGRPPQLDATVGRQVLAWALSRPSFCPQQLCDQLAMRGIRVARSTVRRALRRRRLGTRQQRLGLLERHSATHAGLVTGRTRRELQNARPTASRGHVEATKPGELVCLGCFYIGRLKGVGRAARIGLNSAWHAFRIRARKGVEGEISCSPDPLQLLAPKCARCSCSPAWGAP